jgi:hypothetical protein
MDENLVESEQAKESYLLEENLPQIPRGIESEPPRWEAIDYMIYDPLFP